MDACTRRRRWTRAAGWLLLGWFPLAPAAATAQGPRWIPARDDRETYAVVDALFMQRDTNTNDATLVIDGDTQTPALVAGDLLFPTAPGLRVLLGRHGGGQAGWELGYLGVYGMLADAETKGPGSLEVTPPLSSEVASLANASAAGATYGSSLNMAEANLIHTDRRVSHCRPSGYRFERQPCSATVDWLAGFRWAGLDERAAIELDSGYDVRATSNLFGGQLGVRGRADWRAWALEGWLKAALCGAALSQRQDPIVDAFTGDVYRTGRGSETGTVGGVFDLGGALVYRIDETWGLRAGYTMLWLTGVALAPDQFDFSTNIDAGTAVDGNATLWLGGATLGLEARW